MHRDITPLRVINLFLSLLILAGLSSLSYGYYQQGGPGGPPSGNAICVTITDPNLPPEQLCEESVTPEGEPCCPCFAANDPLACPVVLPPPPQPPSQPPSDPPVCIPQSDSMSIRSGGFPGTGSFPIVDGGFSVWKNIVGGRRFNYGSEMIRALALLPREDYSATPLASLASGAAQCVGCGAGNGGCGCTSTGINPIMMMPGFESSRRLIPQNQVEFFSFGREIIGVYTDTMSPH